MGGGGEGGAFSAGDWKPSSSGWPVQGLSQLGAAGKLVLGKCPEPAAGRAAREQSTEPQRTALVMPLSQNLEEPEKSNRSRVAPEQAPESFRPAFRPAARGSSAIRCPRGYRLSLGVNRSPLMWQMKGRSTTAMHPARTKVPCAGSPVERSRRLAQCRCWSASDGVPAASISLTLAGLRHRLRSPPPEPRP